MFDNLKEKLGSFRSEAEDVADEKAEELDEEDAPEEAAVAADASAAEPTGEADDRSDPSAGERTATTERASADTTEGMAVDAEREPTDASAGSSADGESGGYRGGVAADTDESDSDGPGFGRKAASLARGKFVIEEADLKGPLDQLELALLSSDVEVSVVDEIVGTMRDELVGETRTFTTSTGEVVEDALRTAIKDVISVGQFDVEERVAEAEKPLVIVFTGVNGVGKTTSIAKLDRWLDARGYSTVMANGDTYRAGANEQIKEHAEARGTKLITHEQGGDPAAVLYDAVEYAEANDVDVVLGDTAGRLHTDEGLMDQLEKIGRVVDPDMTLFVDEAVAGQDAVKRAREFNEAVEMDGAILTKADADSNGGAAISIAQVTGKPIIFLGVGQGYDDLERFDPDELANRLLAEE
ncbi:signal recognition particle-docking protein FtsY [Halovivax ruber XH-70]|uniref:Signal recognition particle receptor FtsY n=1 Tax=Halovivax ruber (strain DSM 18193 / JCM 13892 / XH-70) TaxID=797302 RepID=L0I8G6_HALRX|nr:signal recognition particle-docking protein FtsY [Halovivax ruber]AGB14994.1 signal recognition particle-docking protein FtsY [Halovivax ruber XH-70]